MADEKVKTLYRDNEIDGFRMGALFDLRVRFALEVLTHGDLAALVGEMPAGSTPEQRGEAAARSALAATSEIVRQAEAQGLVQAFPEGGEISTQLKRHATRNARWQAEQFAAGQREQQNMAGRIATPAGVPPAILPGNETKQ